MGNVKIFTENIEEEAKRQVKMFSEFFSDSKIRIMPDVHSGKGCVVGFTADLKDRVIPNIVGVDIGCGILCAKLGKVKVDLEHLDKIIHKNIPSGFNIRNKEVYKFDYSELKCYNSLKKQQNFDKAIGTLGGGNHFIELNKDDEDCLYLTIHSGSRSLGNQVAQYYQNKAITYHRRNDKQALKTILEAIPEQEREEKLQKVKVEALPNDLCYLEGQDRLDYLNDMELCQRYARINRREMLKTILVGLRLTTAETIESIHNYIDFEDNIIRKGAISARKGEHLIIPINMRDGCIIGIGKGNEDWNYSAPHGAGRLMSRTKAKQNLNLEDFKDTMKDIYSTTIVESTLDEAPEAYKPMQEIIDSIGDTVEIIKIIKPIYNFKGI